MAKYDKHTWKDGELITTNSMNHLEEGMKTFAENMVDRENVQTDIEQYVNEGLAGATANTLKVVSYDIDQTDEFDDEAQAMARANIDAAKDVIFTGATSSTAGIKGLVPAPSSGEEQKILVSDSTWKTLSLTGYATTSVVEEEVTTIDQGIKLQLDDMTLAQISFQSTALTPNGTDLYGLMSPEEHNKLAGIASSANNYILSAATTSELGGIKVGDGLSIAAETGVLSVINGFPNVSAADNYKQMMVVDGQWELVTLYESAAGHYF